MPSVQVKRGTKSQVDAAATANQLKAGELYLLTDRSLLAVGTGANTYFLTQEVNVVANFSNLPAANSVVPYQERYFVTNVGIGGSEWYSDGTRWRVVGGQVVLRNDRTTLTASSNSALSKLTSSTFSFIQAGDIIEISCTLKKATTVSAFDVGCYFGSTDSPAGASNTSNLTYIGTSLSNTVISYGFRAAWKVLSNTTYQPLFLPYSASSYGGVTVALNDITLSSANLLSNLIVGVSAKTASGTVDNITLDNTLITLRTCG